MALRCYPLQPGGLLAIEAVLIGLTTPESVYEEVTAAFPVILLLIFMVAGIYFLRDLLLFVFTRLILRIRSRAMLALTVLRGRGAAVGVSRCADRGRGGRHGRASASTRSITASPRARRTPRRTTTPRSDDEVQVLHRAEPRRFPRLPALADDARRRRHRDRRRHDAGRRAAEPADRRAGRLELRRVLPGDGAGVDAGRRRRLRDLLAGRALPLVRLRHAAARRGARRARRLRRETGRARHAARPAGADRAGAGRRAARAGASPSTWPRSA